METSEILAASVRMVSALALVLGLVVLAMYFLRKVMSRAADPGRQPETIGILSVRYLGGKNSIALVTVADQIIVVGISPSGMSTLARIEDPAERDRLQAITSRGKDKTSFARQLSLYTSRIRALKAPLEPSREKQG
ncbi:MAG: flagellar biosynthetic protein FliO [Syntrophales bacterium]|nr:flagellar biosynthetic protein FliO [Syntrophales bacterium]